ncbi:hypothetical protein PtB15_15B163 [Puccinia triticina]|nr:hypothetical protein PtB15_15B163 [Puccinia triticina]
MRGQQTDFLSLAGLGYLLVFDTLGAAHALLFDPCPDDGTDRLLAGLGYLLVFDILGAAHALLFDPCPDDGTDRLWDALGRKDTAASIHLPFRKARLATLSIFSQALSCSSVRSTSAKKPSST